MKIIYALLLSLSSLGMAAEVETKSSEFTWEATKVVGGGHHGTIDLKSSDLKTHKGALKSGTFIIDMKSIDVTDLSGDWKTKFVTHITSKDFFQVEKYPTSKLVIDKVVNGQASGKLTIKEKTNPVSFEIEKQKGYYVGKLEIDRTKYGVIYGSGQFFKGLGDKTISDVFSVGFKFKIK